MILGVKTQTLVRIIGVMGGSNLPKRTTNGSTTKMKPRLPGTPPLGVNSCGTFQIHRLLSIPKRRAKAMKMQATTQVMAEPKAKAKVTIQV